MGLETGTYLNALVATNPVAGDPKSQGDDHLRLLKAVLLATFPNLTGAVTVTQTLLNYLSTVTSDVQVQITARGSHAGQVWTGTHNFTGATITVPTGALFEGGTEAASQAYVDSFYDSVTQGSVGTSSTSLTIGIGRHTITASTGKQFYVGQALGIYYTTTPESYSMVGQVVSYNSGSGAMVFAANSVTGSGTYATWGLGPPSNAGFSDDAQTAGFYFASAAR